MNTVIIGGGITGLVAAYKLSKKGFKVTVFESSYFLGGQASVINIGGNKIERGYHHLFKNDKEIIELIEELHLSDSLKWFKSSVGMYSNKKLYPFSTPKDLLSYKPLSLISRIRLGFISLYLKRQKNWKKYETPIISPGAKYDYSHCSEPSLIKIDDKWKIFYEGCDSNKLWRILCAQQS